MTEFAIQVRNCIRCALHGFAACMLLCCAMAVQARSDASDVEMKLLPPYCPDTMGFTVYGDSTWKTSPRANYWVSLMGPSFWHMHHYCQARLNMMRAQKAGVSRTRRIELLDNVQGNCQYVINNAAPGFIMLPEIFTLRGQSLLQLTQPNKAGEAFARARELKPDFWPAYSHWAEYLMHTGRHPEALKLVNSGLQYSPNAEVLIEQFRMLGGKPSDRPKPIEKQPTPAADAAQTAPITEPTQATKIQSDDN